MAARVSVIATVKDECDSISQLLESLCGQTRQPDEVVIVDGGSRDGTLARLRAWESSRRLPLRILAEPGCNISRGRNAAISAAQGPLIASTDAGVRLASDWLEGLAAPLEESGAVPTRTVACGFFLPEATSTFEVAMGATVLPVLADVRPAKFLPSSRSVAFPRTAWDEVGGYPEWLDYCEDLVFDLRLQAHGYRFVFVPKSIAFFRPRGSLRAFSRQYYRYARGDGKADLWRKRHLVRYVSYLGLLPTLSWLGMSTNRLWFAALLLGAAAMLWTPYRRLLPAIRRFRPQEKCRAVLWVPVIRITGDVAKMLGYPVGLCWRWRHRSALTAWQQ